MKNDNTQYGFVWGAAAVRRLCSDDKKGWVYIGVDTPKQCIEIYVTKSGKVRLFDGKTKREIQLTELQQ